VKFWDSSAVVSLVVQQKATAAMRGVALGDPLMLVWWGTGVECASALARLEREGALDSAGVAAAFGQLSALGAGWQEIDAGDLVRQTATRLLRVHPLRAADALQLAAAFVAADGLPPTLELVTLDERLAVAAHKEGFPVVLA
jgi:hypothetical protein